MNSAKKSFLTAGAVVLSCAAVLAGTLSRNRADLHLSSPFNFFASTHSLVASTANTAPGAGPGDYYEFVSELLKRDYVDPVTDERKLSTGAVKGMVNFLEDADSRFMSPEEFKVFAEASSGKFEGVGVELGYENPSNKELRDALPPALLPFSQAKASDSSTNLDSDGNLDTGHLPAVVIEAVIPGSPADKAGLKAGDSLKSVDGMWVMNPYEINNLAVISLAVKKEQDAHKSQPPTQALTDLTREYLDIRRDLRKKLKNSLTPAKAMDRLTMGTSGDVTATWTRGQTLVTTRLAKSITPEEEVSKEPNGAIAVHFQPGVSSKLKSILNTGPVTLDLRENKFGDPAELKPCLELFGPAGAYGKLVNNKGKAATVLATTEGAKPRNLKLIVDRSTAGVAEMFALALQSRGYAKLEGPPMSHDRNLVETFKLSDGSGYTLVTAKYETGTELARSKS